MCEFYINFLTQNEQDIYLLRIIEFYEVKGAHIKKILEKIAYFSNMLI